MSIQILHTADLHIGLNFSSYANNEEVRQHLINERFEALARIIQYGNEQQCHFLIIAGDLFDGVNMPKKTIKKVVELLRNFQQQVLVLPGNHDYISADNKLWSSFLEDAADSNILLLQEKRVYIMETEEGIVHFYACPCPSKHSEINEIAWVKAVAKQPDVFHVGIAHGNVEGLGLDAEGRYFNMTEAELKQAGLHTWLLGHVHVPAPAETFSGNPIYFMSGTHTPESIKRSYTGQAWHLHLQPNGNTSFKKFISGSLLFRRLQKEVNHFPDIESLQQQLKQLSNPAATLVELTVTGCLSDEEIQQLERMINDITPAFLWAKVSYDLNRRIDRAVIDKEFPSNTLAHALLTKLADAAIPHKELTLDLAYKLIKEKQR